MSNGSAKEILFRGGEAGNTDVALGMSTNSQGRPASLSRRVVLIGLSGAVSLAACGKRGASVVPPATELPARQALDFLRLSQSLTGHVDLDLTTAGRLTTSFSKAVPKVFAKFGELGALVRTDIGAQELLDAATGAGLRDAALAIVAAWYTGTVGTGTTALTVSYRDALMQRAVEDALLPPTYAHGGPAWWTATPPDVGMPSGTPAKRSASDGSAG